MLSRGQMYSTPRKAQDWDVRDAIVSGSTSVDQSVFNDP